MMFDTFGDMSSTLTYRPGVPPLRDRSEPTAEQIEKWSPDKMIEDLLSVRGKAMTKPVPMVEQDVKSEREERMKQFEQLQAPSAGG